MPRSRPLPQAVRGCWYYVPPSFEVKDGLTKTRQVITFGVDGTYTRYEIKKDRRKEAESGEYTFDGHFLIIRGRRTHTFRVHRPAFWRWMLEGKKKSWVLMRGLATEDAVEMELPEADQRDIRLLPLRAEIEADFKDNDVIHRVVYDQDERDRRLLGTFFVEHLPGDHLWVGVTPLVRQLEDKTWERIIRESYLDKFMGKPKDVETVTVQLLDSHQSREFDY